MRRNGKTKEMLLPMAGILIGAVIGCVVLIPEGYRYQTLFAIVGIWVAALYHRSRKEQEKQRKARAMQVIDLEPDYKKLFSQQLQLRVQEQLRAKFPGAAVDLCDGEIERLATMGKAVYVPIRKAEDYCHISIALKSTGDIQMNLFSFVSLENAREGRNPTAAERETDVEQWFTQKGQQLLTELITSMNSRGYSRLSISETGEVTVKENGRNVLKEHFREIPPKKQWAKLKELMAEEDVQVQVSGRQLTLAW